MLIFRRRKLVCSSMTFLHEPEDIEPLDAGERCDKAYGNYHIGREDESRDELALFFDTRWLPEPDFLDRKLSAIINHYDGRVIAFSEYASTEHSDEQLQELLRLNICAARSFDAVINVDLSVAVVELVKPTVAAVDTGLRAYTAYVGYGIISWPSIFRSVITARMDYV